MITLSLIAIVYIGFVALVQADMKRLIAYSSISHMGFVTLGLFLFSVQGAEGALAQIHDTARRAGGLTTLEHLPQGGLALRLALPLARVDAH